MPFRNRADAGRKLAKVLASYKKRQPVVLALPRGGVPIAAEVCAALSAPVDLILVRKIGVPFQPELAMGAVVDGSAFVVVRNEDVIQHANIDEATFNAGRDTELSEIEQRRQRYLGTRDRVEIAGRTAIVIDDGVATGATMRVALRAVRARKPQRLVLAVPVAPASTVAELRSENKAGHLERLRTTECATLVNSATHASIGAIDCCTSPDSFSIIWRYRAGTSPTCAG